MVRSHFGARGGGGRERTREWNKSRASFSLFAMRCSGIATGRFVELGEQCFGCVSLIFESGAVFAKLFH